MSNYTLDLQDDFSPFGHCAFLKRDIFKFPAGESHIKLLDHDYVGASEIFITSRINNGSDLMLVLLANDAIHNHFKKATTALYIPYIPYARQDRRMVGGEPFSLKVFANLLNSQKFTRVITNDPHSDVAGALIDNLEVAYPNYLFSFHNYIKAQFEVENYVMIAPDGGALKKIYKTAQVVGHKGEVFCATKIRDLNTGKIIRSTIDATNEDLQGKVCVIYDDICSYGGTFSMLAKLLKEKGASKVVLCVTHYEGVADTEKLFADGIDKILTTDSICTITDKHIAQFKI